MWVCRRSFVGNGCWLQNEMGEMELAAELGEFLGYRCAEKWKQEATIAGKLMEIICDPERFVGLSMSLGNPLIRSVKQEIKSCLLYTSPSPRDKRQSRMPSSA